MHTNSIELQLTKLFGSFTKTIILPSIFFGITHRRGGHSFIRYQPTSQHKKFLSYTYEEYSKRQWMPGAVQLSTAPAPSLSSKAFSTTSSAKVPRKQETTLYRYPTVISAEPEGPSAIKRREMTFFVDMGNWELYILGTVITVSIAKT